MTEQFSHIYELCMFVLSTENVKNTLIKQCLKTFSAFLSWIPYGFIFETELIGKLLGDYFPVPSFRNDTLACLREIAGLKIEQDTENYQTYVEAQYNLYREFIKLVHETTQGINFSTQHSQISDAQANHYEIFCRQLGLLITEFLKNHLEQIEQIIYEKGEDPIVKELMLTISRGLEYLIQLSNIPDDEIFRFMMEYWKDFTHHALIKIKGNEFYSVDMQQNMMKTQDSNLIKIELYSIHYPAILDDLTFTMINKMAKPKEVLVVEDENGNAVEEIVQDSENISLYECMRETLVYITHVDNSRVDKIISKRLEELYNGH